MRVLKFIIPALALFASCNQQASQTNSSPIDSAKILNSKYEIAYEVDGKIVATNIDTTKQVSFGGASFPAISPDGNKLAYTVEDSLGNKSIWYADMENKSQNQIKINSANYTKAIWAANSNKLAFSFLNKKNIWKTGITHVDHSDLVLFEENSNKAYFNPTWKGEAEIAVHDLEKLYIFNINGKISSTLNLSEITKNEVKIDANSRFFYTQNNNAIIFNAGGLIYNYDLNAKTLKSISDTAITVSELFLTFNDKIVFSGTKNATPISKIYSCNLEGKDFKVLVEKGNHPSAN
jgi:TolB protein